MVTRREKNQYSLRPERQYLRIGAAQILPIDRVRGERSFDSIQSSNALAETLRKVICETYDLREKRDLY